MRTHNIKHVEKHNNLSVPEKRVERPSTLNTCRGTNLDLDGGFEQKSPSTSPINPEQMCRGRG